MKISKKKIAALAITATLTGLFMTKCGTNNDLATDRYMDRFNEFCPHPEKNQDMKKTIRLSIEELSGLDGGLLGNVADFGTIGDYLILRNNVTKICYTDQKSSDDVVFDTKTKTLRVHPDLTPEVAADKIVSFIRTQKPNFSR